MSPPDHKGRLLEMLSTCFPQSKLQAVMKMRRIVLIVKKQWQQRQLILGKKRGDLLLWQGESWGPSFVLLEETHEKKVKRRMSSAIKGPMLQLHNLRLITLVIVGVLDHRGLEG
jgi:hypothetical protein